MLLGTHIPLFCMIISYRLLFPEILAPSFLFSLLADDFAYSCPKKSEVNWRGIHKVWHYIYFWPAPAQGHPHHIMVSLPLLLTRGYFQCTFCVFIIFLSSGFFPSAYELLLLFCKKILHSWSSTSLHLSSYFFVPLYKKRSSEEVFVHSRKSSPFILS